MIFHFSLRSYFVDRHFEIKSYKIWKKKLWNSFLENIQFASKNNDWLYGASNTYTQKPIFSCTYQNHNYKIEIRFSYIILLIIESSGVYTMGILEGLPIYYSDGFHNHCV